VEASSRSLGTQQSLNITYSNINLDYIPKQLKYSILTHREGTGIAKFKRGRWSATDESPQKKQKSSHTDSGIAHSNFPIINLFVGIMV
jgi:hypothetical protein